MWHNFKMIQNVCKLEVQHKAKALSFKVGIYLCWWNLLKCHYELTHHLNSSSLLTSSWLTYMKVVERGESIVYIMEILV